MNTYTKYLETSAEEISVFAASKEGPQCDSKYYQQISDLAEKARIAPTDDEAERYLDMLLWCIVESIPPGKAFAPSIDIAADAMLQKRREQFKARRIAKEKR